MMVVNTPETTAMKRIRHCLVSTQMLKATAKVMMIPKNTAAYGFEGARRSFQFNQFIKSAPFE
jgi:hypothetical protein